MYVVNPSNDVESKLFSWKNVTGELWRLKLLTKVTQLQWKSRNLNLRGPRKTVLKIRNLCYPDNSACRRCPRTPKLTFTLAGILSYPGLRYAISTVFLHVIPKTDSVNKLELYWILFLRLFFILFYFSISEYFLG
jgi:hypothetical protein